MTADESERRRPRRRALAVALLAAVSASAAAGWVWAVPALVERTVRAVLLEHPEVILEAVDVLRSREEATLARQQLAALGDRAAALRTAPDSPVGGNPDGDVTVVEFYDYKCRFCRAFHPELIAVLARDPNVRVVFKEFPILGPESDIAARAALAAHDQGPEQFLALHRALMEAPGVLDEDTVVALAADHGIDPDRLRIGMADPSIDRRIRENRELAEAIGIRGTPGLVIGDAIVRGYVDAAEVLRLVDAARQECTTCGDPPRTP